MKGIFLGSGTLLKLLFSLVLTASFVVASAQMAFESSVDSIDLQVDDAASVTVAKISEISPKNSPNSQGQEVTFDVTKTLKGLNAEIRKIRFDGYSAPELEKLRADGTLVLLGSDTVGMRPWIIPLNSSTKISTESFDIITDPDALLEYVRRRVREHPDRGSGVSFGNSYVFNAQTGYTWKRTFGKNSLKLRVPIDSDLESVGRRLIEKRPSDQSSTLAGISIISHFQDSENIRLLKSVLADPSHYFSGSPDSPHVSLPEYPIREAAYRQLGLWGVTVSPPPLLKDGLDHPETVSGIYWNSPTSPADLEVIAKSKGLTSLKLERAGRDFPSGQLMETIRNFPRLTELELQKMRIKDADLQNLKSLKNLKKLDLSNNPITDEGAKALADLPSLTELDLYNTRLTRDTVRALKERHPKLVISPAPEGFTETIHLLPQTTARCDKLVYRLDPSDTALSNWTSRPTGDLSTKLEWGRSPSGRAYIGPFGQQAVTLNLKDLPTHGNLSIEIDLWIIGSWDGDGSLGAGPDIMDIQVPNIGTALHSTFFNNSDDHATHLRLQSYPDPFPQGRHVGYTGAAEVRSLGFTNLWSGVTYHRDAVYRLHYTIAHSSSDFQIVLTGENVFQYGTANVMDDECWGIGAVTVNTD